MKHGGFCRIGISVAVAGALSAGVSQAHASAFALQEQNASGLGTAYAGASASAEDVSTIYFNPAGMSLLPGGKQFAVGVDLIEPSTKFSNNGSLPSGSGIPIGSAVRPLGGNGGNAGSLAPVPHFYFAMDGGRDWKFGVGMGAPFGLKTEYSSDWTGRFQGIKSSIETININPSVSYRANDKVSLGFGLNYQTIEAELTQAVNYVAGAFGGVLRATGSAATAGAVAGAIPAAIAEGSLKVEGSDSAWGYNFGAMFALSPMTRLGVAYRSAVKYQITGTADFSGVPPGLPAAVAAGLSGGNVSVDIKMPDTFSLALSHQPDQKWTVLGDLTWTGWAKIKELKIVREGGSTLGVTPENFRNTLRVGVGAIYRYNDRWSTKAGLAYDQTPVNDVDRTPRLPDQDRTWLAIGAQYRPSKNTTIDISYAHLFVKGSPINQDAGNVAGYGRLTGNYDNSVDILGVQFGYRF